METFVLVVWFFVAEQGGGYGETTSPERVAIFQTEQTCEQALKNWTDYEHGEYPKRLFPQGMCLRTAYGE